MRYRVRRTCTDFDGTYYTAGMEVELNDRERHSSFLIPLEAEKPSASAPAAVENKKSKPRKRKTGKK